MRPQNLVPRLARDELLQLAEGYPVVAVVGPLQSGKTTLCRSTFPELPYVSLEDPDVRRFAKDDPRGFLGQYSEGALLDEIQRAPDLLSYLQGIVDNDPRPGRFIVTGSSQLSVVSTLGQHVTQSLAGRAALLELLPFSLSELAQAGRAPETLEELLVKGLYPPIYDRDLDPRRWYGNYVQTYVERDVRQLVQVRDLGSFQAFVRLCAGRTGQLLNFASLASDAGVAPNTAKAWISVLEASYVVKLLRPYFSNYGKRLVKTPKLYFLEPGLAAWLLEIQDPSHVATHPLRGALFETWVISELIKGRAHRGLAANLYFWRDRQGLEIDCVLDGGPGALQSLGAKSGKTVPSGAGRALRRFSTLAGSDVTKSWLLYGGERIERREDVTVLPWTEIEKVVEANA